MILYEDSVPVRDLELPTRLANVLIEKGVRNVGDLRRAALTPRFFDRTRNVGKKSLAEAAPIMRAIGLPGWEEIDRANAPTLEVTIAGRRWRSDRGDGTVRSSGIRLSEVDLRALLRLIEAAGAIPDLAG